MPAQTPRGRAEAAETIRRSAYAAQRPGRPTTPPQGPERRGNRRGLVLVVLVVLLVALVALAGWWLGMGRYTSTPGVVNLSRADAQAKLADAGLELEVVGRKFSEDVTRGSVLDTDPRAGARIVRGDTVAVVLSRGPERYGVPTLSGRTLEEVAGVLADRNLALGDVREVWHDSVPAGLVIGSTPPAGTEMRRDATVDVAVSKGPRPIRIPDFTTKSAERAEARLTELGFRVAVTEQNHDQVEEGRVISQTPSSGTGFEDDQIKLVVSLGPVMVEVPSVTAMPVEEATEQLEELGFEVRTEQTPLYVGLGRVVKQSPGADTEAPEGSTITLSIV